PIDDAPMIYGWQEAYAINGAVLKLPAGHAVLDELQAIFTTWNWIPPWETIRNRVRWTVKYRVQREFGVADMVWGMTGPRALTHYLRRHGLADYARPVDAFYPVAWTEAELLTGPHREVVRARIMPSTACIHLWNQARASHH